MKGVLISFEGIDFSGKSVQANLLKENLVRKGFSVILLREPGGTEISEKIREVLLDKGNDGMVDRTEVLLYSAARAQMVAERVVPHLKRGGVVICDRYFDSTTAYQGYGREIDLDFIKQLHKFAIQDIVPDITFLIDIDLEEAVRRSEQGGHRLDRLEQEGEEFRERVRAGYLAVAEEEPERFVVVDGRRSVAEIQEEILSHVKKKLKI
ncbi:MAG: dTMP kinase [Calditrichaeota bacterium]|nr:MAG: dTMP kinase [Calditrichota bacterium]